MTGGVEAKAAPSRPVAPIAILADKLARLVAEAGALTDSNPAFLETLKEAERIASGLERYVATCTTPESTALSALRTETQALDWARLFRTGETKLALEAEMVSGHVEGQFLKMLVHATKAERVLEIGLFTGYSALAMAEALPDHGELVACEVDNYAAAFAQSAFARSAHGRKIRIELGPAMRTVRLLAEAGQVFDLIFIDADKTGYRDYYRLVLGGGLLAPNGLLCIDNTLMQGQPYMLEPPTTNGRAIRDFNHMVCNDPRVDQVLLPLRDGLTLIRRVENGPARSSGEPETDAY